MQGEPGVCSVQGGKSGLDRGERSCIYMFIRLKMQGSMGLGDKG